jgi:hypothetical protein
MEINININYIYMMPDLFNIIDTIDNKDIIIYGCQLLIDSVLKSIKIA